MEKKNLPTNRQQSIALSTKEQELAPILFRVNQLVTFSLDSTQIEDWAISINKLHPGITLKTLDLIIDRLMTGEYEWDHRSAIQNVFNGINEYKKELKKATDAEYNEMRLSALDLGISIEEYMAFKKESDEARAKQEMEDRK